MRLYTIFAIALIATTVSAADKDKDKRRAQNYATASTPKSTYVSSTSSPAYVTATSPETYVTASTAAPAYATKIAPKLQYVSQPVSYEQQQITIQQPSKISYAAQPVKYSQPAIKYAAQPAVTYVSQPQQQFSYSFDAQHQPDFKYVAQQPDIRYVAQQPEVKYVSQAQPDVKYVNYVQPQADVKYLKFAQPAPQPQPAVKYVLAPQQQQVKYAYQPAQPVAAKQVVAAPAKIHYSPADSVSHFRFSSPHVTYSNLGVLSQLVGKAYAPQPQTVVAQPAHSQVAYAAPSTQYVTAAHGATQQAAYAPVQYHQVPQVQYVAAAPQAQHSTQQYVYALPQNIAYARPKAGITYA